MASGLLSGLWISQLHMMGKIPGAALRKERLSLRGESCDKAPKGHQQRCSQLRPMELSRCFLFSMTKFEDANFLYEAGTKAIKPSPYKYGTQLFEMNHLLETAKLQRAFQTGTYEPQPGVKFEIKERGHERFITSTATVDKAVSHLTCDEYLTPLLKKYLQYDNSASQKGKGVAFHRHRFKVHLRQYYEREGSNEGYILFSDFSGYYASILHDVALAQL